MSRSKFSKLCRTCMLDTGEMRSLFATGTILGQTAKLSDVLLACAELQIAKDDGLPQQICMRCVHQVSRAYSFRKQCEKSQASLLIELRKPAARPVPRTPSTSQARRLSNNDNLLCVLEDGSEVVGVEENESDGDDGNRDDDNTGNDNDSEETKEISPLTAIQRKIAAAVARSKLTIPSRPKATAPAISGFNNLFNRRGTYTNKCRQCGKEFNLVSALRIHCFREHRGLPDFPKCRLCPKICRSEEQMKRHMNIHNTGKPFQCEQCGKTFCQRAAYIAHTYSHTGERPYLCTECGKTFKQNSELKIHMRMHLDLRPYSCEICGKSYRNSSLFAIHKRVHSGERPFACTFCDKKFISSSCLKNHVMIHTGEKPFTCDYCSRSFNRSNALRIHRKIHTGERPFVCAICGKGFIQGHCLQSHMNTHKSA